MLAYITGPEDNFPLFVGQPWGPKLLCHMVTCTKVSAKGPQCNRERPAGRWAISMLLSIPCMWEYSATRHHNGSHEMGAFLSCAHFITRNHSLIHKRNVVQRMFLY